ncbi:MAG: transcription-repair coupling factor, partial [Clostridia bacterium]|nr:transcription-repair coupling factor [Clostridia bacterium]
DNNVSVEVLDNIWREDNLKKSKVYITYGIVSGGFYSSIQDLVVIAEPVSGTNVKRKVKREFSKGTDIESFEDLKIDDFVVHENHGIGIYKGISSINVQEVVKDYIKIEYANNGVLYVPINQLDLVKKYVCDDSSKPKINSLGTKEWEKTKKKVTAHVEEIAKELLSLYAKREKNPGYAFSPDTPWQKEFEESFKYDLTDDQKQAVSEIKEDMESPRVMDRLLCGDVGYGKTEVALRVAFKAVMDKKQVAYLVPTTVLCLQQYRTFKERMEKFGIRVEMLSRFKTKKEQTDILKDLVDGKIDVLVGTHRMLSNDVFFKDLGLLIIDEEHRFGVKAKESIKKIKETVDVLSMTATPIPRTLHMSMVGIRGMSTLNEPPLERLPVHTYVMEYNDTVIKEAIEKELLRDGQVFYLNNRVEGIEDLANKVKSLVPSARVEYAHGQMEPHQIEDIMLKFINHEFDVIVCTSILESGIDIPNANTLIVENADKLGLAQLYQIRGRVGRSSRLAYAYITYQKNRQISEVAEKRLRAIRDFTEFGSGFKIALRDLEIRGAGSLLGKEQHGHMLKVGYDMYLSLLEKAVNKEKNNISETQNIEQEIKIDLDVSAYISDSYISDPIQKINMYQKISDINDKDMMLDVIDELIDRYGELPKETENLIKIVEIRNQARKLGITKICSFGEILKIEPYNLKIKLTNFTRSDILIRVQLELEKLRKEKGKSDE